MKSQQQKETKALLEGVLKRWAPFPNDPLEHKMMRALLNLNAFEMDCERVRKGEKPIRTDYPIPLPDQSKMTH